MSDAFRNYDSLLQSLDSANSMKDEAESRLHQTKASAADIGKTIGEAKTFISGKPLLKNISEKIIKPAYNQYGKPIVDDIKKTINEKFEQASNKIFGPDKAKPADPAAPAEEDATEGLGSGESAAVPDAELADNSDRINEILEDGANRAKIFENKVANGTAEGDELTPEVSAASKIAGNPELQTLEQWKGSNAENFSQAKSTFTSEDLGAKPGQVFNRETGLTDEESGELDDLVRTGKARNDSRS